MAATDNEFLGIVQDEYEKLKTLNTNFLRKTQELMREATRQFKAIPPTEIEQRKKVLENNRKLIGDAIKNFEDEVIRTNADTREKLTSLRSAREKEIFTQYERELNS